MKPLRIRKGGFILFEPTGAGVAQSAEQRIRNAQVGGSSPPASYYIAYAY